MSPAGATAIVPARGGSRRIPRKNLAPLDGHPLIAHTLRAALGAREVREVHVTTDDPEIADVARRYGAGVIHRPPELAGPEAPTEPALIHAVREVERRSGRPSGTIVLLQPTSPLRGSARIDEAVRLLRESGCDAVVSVTPDVHHYFLGDIDAGGRLHVGYDPRRRLRTQEIPPRYRENGAIYVMTRTLLLGTGCRMGGDTRALVMDPLESIDIDTTLDLDLCRVVLQRRRAEAGDAPRAAAAAG